jgi:hypothetical protein
MMEDWKNNIFIPVYRKGDKQKVENYSRISLLNACYKLCSKILNEKLIAQAEKFHLDCQIGF